MEARLPVADRLRHPPDLRQIRCTKVAHCVEQVPVLPCKTRCHAPVNLASAAESHCWLARVSRKFALQFPAVAPTCRSVSREACCWNACSPRNPTDELPAQFGHTRRSVIRHREAAASCIPDVRLPSLANDNSSRDRTRNYDRSETIKLRGLFPYGMDKLVDALVCDFSLCRGPPFIALLWLLFAGFPGTRGKRRCRQAVGLWREIPGCCRMRKRSREILSPATEAQNKIALKEAQHDFAWPPPTESAVHRAVEAFPENHTTPVSH
jgi:hypothetical protein